MRPSARGLEITILSFMMPLPGLLICGNAVKQWDQWEVPLCSTRATTIDTSYKFLGGALDFTFLCFQLINKTKLIISWEECKLTGWKSAGSDREGGMWRWQSRTSQQLRCLKRVSDCPVGVEGGPLRERGSELLNLIPSPAASWQGRNQQKVPSHWVSLTWPHVPKAPVLELIKLTLTHLLQSSGSPGKLIQSPAASDGEGAHICICLLMCNKHTCSSWHTHCNTALQP